MNRIRLRMRVSVRTTAIALAVAGTATLAAGAEAGDCAPGAVRADIESETLTRAERIARLDDALNESLARFDECQNDVPAPAEPDSGTETASGGPEGPDGNAGDTTAAAGDGNARRVDPAGDGGGMESVAAPGMEGTQPPENGAATTSGSDAKPVAATGVEGTQSREDATGTTSDTPRRAGSGGTPGDDSDDVPDDIPRGDNDSVLEAQIRRAAMEETDPRIRAELWNEYRKYKGLPVKPLPDDDGDPPDADTSQ